ncbi:MAG: transporter [Candidatus Contendobacter sp.]|nr:MAG: transporter [Candidatus Contendobacter sp.]
MNQSIDFYPAHKTVKGAPRRRSPGARANRRFGLRGPVALLLVACGLPVTAQETNHYPNGTSGILAGSVPGPGLYYLMYNLLYDADRLKNSAGHAALAPDGNSLDFRAKAFANVHRLIHVTRLKFLGAEFSWNVAVPLVYRSVRINNFGIDDSDFALGDVNLEPLVLEWRGPQWDFGIGYGLFAPTGDRDDQYPAEPGKDFWTHYPIVAGTWFFDQKRTWSASFLSRYEFHGKREDVDITPGRDISVEWGVGKSFGTLTVGVSGYAQWQVTSDTGADISYDASVHDRVFGIGPEVQYFFPEHGFGFQLRHWREFGARDRSEGSITTLTLVKPF